MQPSFQYHVFMCLNKRDSNNTTGCCSSKGGMELFDYLKASVKKLNLKNIRINKAGCLGTCNSGIAAVIYPENSWYSLQNKEDIDLLIQNHLVNHEKVISLLM